MGLDRGKNSVMLAAGTKTGVESLHLSTPQQTHLLERCWMSKAIIAAVRTLPQLKGSLLLTAIELAHMADGYDGTARVSYSFLARKTRLHQNTMIQHIKKLLALKIIRCQRFQRYGRHWLTNRYIFLIPWKLPIPARLSSSTVSVERLPEPKREEKKRDLERGKWGNPADEARWFTRGLTFWTPGSLQERLARGG